MKIDDPLYTTAVHAGSDPQSDQGALSVPVHHASVYAFPDAARGAAIHAGKEPGFFYGRMGTPTQAALERALCELEGGEEALATASGMSAIVTTLLTLLRPGDHLVAPRCLYATTATLLDDLLEPFGIAVSHVDGSRPESFAEAARPETKVFYVESPANPTLDIIDIEAVAALARQRGIVTVADNTFATPCNQRPLALGADVVVHSATKYLGGHGDLVAGVAVGSASILGRARWHTAKILGGVIAPQTAWLVLRGLRTLPLRMERHNHNAGRVAAFLAEHPKVRQVRYPGLPAHPGHDLARRQMSGFGGMVSFDVGDRESGRRVVDGVKLCSRAVSLGDVATLIQHSASMTHAPLSEEQRREAGISDGLLRLSVGIERAQDIIQDLDGALQSI